MENMDQAIPFVVLVTVSLLLLLLLRRTSTSPTSDELPPSPTGRVTGGEGTSPLQLPKVVPATTTPAVEAPPIVPTAPANTAKLRRKRVAKSTPAPVEPTPIETVAGLLKQKNTLVAAFVLREIFAPPVSRR